MTYHVVPITVTLLVFYLFSLYLSHTGFITRIAHRRMWNWLLLISFLVAGVLGIILALRVTYRWELAITDQMMHWHVDAGIAMALLALIHFIRHFNYYFRRARSGVSEADGHNTPGESSPAGEESPAGGGTAGKKGGGTAGKTGGRPGTGSIPLRPLLLLIGFVSSSSQFIMMREAAILGGGTEATTGLYLWLWLIIAAVGAAAGRRSAISSLKVIVWSLLGAAAIAPVSFLMMNSLLLSPGETPSLLQSVLIMAVSVAPVTFVSALIFVRLSDMRQRAGLSSAGGSFGVETAGSVAAGLFTTLTVTLTIPNYQLYLLILLVATAWAVWFLGYPLRARVIAVASLLPLLLLLFIIRPDRYFRSLLLRGIVAEESIDTPFGNITTGLYGGERVVYYDHRPLFFEDDVISAEENIHYALLQRSSFDKVLLLSGGLHRHLPHLALHNVRSLTYLEMDPGLIAVEGAADTTYGTMEVKVVRDDPIAFLSGSDDLYDAVIQLIPPPSTLSVNRFYTVEYFRLIGEHLTSDGIFMSAPMPWYSYSPESYRRGFSPLYNSLSDVFSHIALIPGSLLYAVASGRPVTSSVVRLTGEKGIEGEWVNSDYLNDQEIRSRAEQVLLQIDRGAGLNKALRPESSLFTNLLTLERMGVKGGVVALLVLLILIPFIFTARGGYVMFAASAGLSGFGMIMIFMLQMVAGNIYILTALILTLLMAGLAAGAALGDHLSLRKLMRCTTILALIFGLSGLLAPLLATSSALPVMVFIIVMLPLAGLVTGAVYRILTSRSDILAAGNIYAADMAGSALGYLTAATVIVPLAGIANACYIMALFILLSGIVASVTRKE